MKVRSRVSIIIFAIVAVLAIGIAISAIVSVNKLETTKTVGTFAAYDVGKLSETDGRGMSPSDIEDFNLSDNYEGYMHLKSKINADGLKIKLTEDAEIKYKVYLYDEDYLLLSVTSWLSSEYSFADNVTSSTSSAKYAMVEIKPIRDEDGFIRTTEISKYAKMITITYNKFED